jgi:hypothetical protein
MNATRRWDFRGGSTPRAHPLFLFQLFIALALLLGAPSARSQEPPPDRVCKMCHQEANTARAVKDAKIHGKVACIRSTCRTPASRATTGIPPPSTPRRRGEGGAVRDQRARSRAAHRRPDRHGDLRLLPRRPRRPPSSTIRPRRPRAQADPRHLRSLPRGILRDLPRRRARRGLLEGGLDVPVCTDCHREHAVSDPASEGSSVSPSWSPRPARAATRRRPRASLRPQAGVRSDLGRAPTTASPAPFGEQGAANCASCHGFHDIFPSSDARSPVHVANLEQHLRRLPQRTRRGLRARARALHGRRRIEPGAWYWVKTIYTGLVAV